MNFFEKLHMYEKFWRYRYRSEEAEDIKYLLSQNLTDKTILDVGANLGIYTYWMSKTVGPRGKVVAFEPQPELEEHLNDVVKTFSLPNVNIVTTALSDNSGEEILYRTKVGCGGATFTPNDYSKQVRVHKTTLDDFIEKENITDVSFIKADVERHEINVFRGATKTLLKHSPTLLFECSHDEAVKGELFNFLSDLGYEGFFLRKGEQIPYAKFLDFDYGDVNRTHRNYIFTKK